MLRKFLLLLILLRPDPFYQDSTCDYCYGTGWQRGWMLFGPLWYPESCNVCRGKGWYPKYRKVEYRLQGF